MNKLNDQQLAAVTDIASGPILITSGPGTGKTLTLIKRAEYILNHESSAKKILIISFTRRAVSEIRMRIGDDKNMEITTFHSFFFRILKANGYKSFSITTENGTRIALIKKALAITKLEDEFTSEVILEALAKGNYTGTVKTAIEVYFDILKQQRMLDFDCLQYFCLELLEAAPAVVRAIRSMYSNVMIDEANDINTVQWQIIRKLWDTSANICLVGDHRQAIYGFRGSYAKIFSDYIERYDPRVYELTKCYRCGQGILELANNLMSKYTPMTSAKDGPYNKPVFYSAKDARGEAKYICAEIKASYLGGTKLNDMVILYRSAPVIASICEELLNQNIPFVKLGAMTNKWLNNPFKPILALLRYLNDISNDNNLAYCGQILGIPSDIATKAVASHKKNPHNQMIEILTSLTMLPKATKDKLVRFYAASDEVKELTFRQSVLLTWDLLVKDYIRAENDAQLEEILNETDNYKSFDDLKEHIIQMRKQYKAMTELTADKNADYIRVMSIHSAKGLEWGNVFLVGCTDGILPDTSHEGVDISEENRLAYVAATRAKERLFISYPLENSKSKEPNKPSRFFQDGFNFGQNKMAATMVAEKKETIL